MNRYLTCIGSAIAATIFTVQHAAAPKAA